MNIESWFLLTLPALHTKTCWRVQLDAASYKFYSLKKLKDERLSKLPYSIRVLLESAGKDSCS